MIDINKFSDNLIAGMIELKPGFDDVFLNNAGAVLRRRIFNDGKATEGEQIGQYKESSRLLREQKGQETSYVNLEDTGTLRRSVQVGLDSDSKVLGIIQSQYENGFDTPRNSEYQELNFKKDIFTISDGEIEEALQGAEQWLDKELDRVIQEALNNA